MLLTGRPDGDYNSPCSRIELGCMMKKVTDRQLHPGSINTTPERDEVYEYEPVEELFWC